jgi:hypothetical protein
MTPEQERALAMARARARAAAQATTPAGGPVQPPPEAPKPFDRAGGHGAFNAGMAEATIKGVLGVKQLFGGLSDEDKAVLEQIKLENEADPEGFKRGAGELAANVLTTIVPGGAATKTAKAAGLVKTLGKAAMTAGATEALTGVGEGDTYEQQMLSKAENALKAAGTGAVFSGVLGGAAKAYKGLFRAKPEVAALVAQGVVPTLQQGADSGVGRFVGGLASGATSVRNRQEQQIANAVVHKATEGMVDRPQATGREILDSARDYVKGEYQKLFGGKRYNMSPAAVSDAQQAAQALNNRGQFAAEATDAGRAVANVLGETGATNRRLGIDKLRDEYLTPLSKAAYAEANDETKQRILAARQVIIDQVRNAKLTKAERARLGELDVRNFDVERIREAVKGKVGEEEGITLSRLATAYGKNKMAGNDTMDTLIGPALRVLGNTPTQDEARTAKQIGLRILGGTGALTGGAALTGNPLLAAGIAGGYGLSALGQTEKGAKALLGQYNSQKWLAELLREHANVIPAVGAGIGTYPVGE